MTTYYIREDGTASKPLAIGPETDASACMSLSTHNGATFTAGDVITVSGLGGDYSVEIRPYAGCDYIGSNAPTFSGANAQGLNVLAKDNVTMTGDFTILNATNREARIENCNDFIVDGLQLPAIDSGIFGLRAVVNSGVAVDGLTIKNGTYTTAFNNKEQCYITFTNESWTNIVFDGNTTNYGYIPFHLFGTEATTGANPDWRPSKVDVNGNTFNIPYSDAIKTTCGIKWDGTEADRSYIRNNIVNDCGADDSANTNAFGLQNCEGIICEYNLINGVVTSVPDGHGIIVDWSYKSDSFISDGAIVRLNELTRCNSNDTTCSGVIIFKGKNGFVNSNLSHNNAVGISCNNDASVDNGIYNNTCYENSSVGLRMARLDDNSLGADGTIAKNNIFYGGDYGLLLSNGVPTSTLDNDYNCYYRNAVESRWDNANSQTIAETNAVEADPLFVDPVNGDFNLQETSPCVGAGVKWWGNKPRPISKSGEPLPDEMVDLGAYQSTWHPRHPVNL